MFSGRQEYITKLMIRKPYSQPIIQNKLPFLFSFISKSLKNLIQQLYIYDSLWKIDIPQEKFGNYRDNCNHKKYAEFLKTELLKIDEDLLKNDTGYFWGSLIEDIEFGIVG